MTPQPSTDIQSTLKEQRVFDPPPEFSRPSARREPRRIRAPLRRSRSRSRNLLGQTSRASSIGSSPGPKFSSGTRPGRNGSSAASSTSRTTASTAIVTTWRKNKAALIWEGEPGEIRTLTYQQLHLRSLEVRQRAEIAGRQEGRSRRHLHGHDAGTGHCAARLRPHRRAAYRHLRRLFRAGADRPHQRFPGVCVITQDGSYRRGAEIKLKPAVDEALPHCPTVKNVIVYQRTGTASTWSPAATTGGTS